MQLTSCVEEVPCGEVRDVEALGDEVSAHASKWNDMIEKKNRCESDVEVIEKEVLQLLDKKKMVEDTVQYAMKVLAERKPITLDVAVQLAEKEAITVIMLLFAQCTFGNSFSSFFVCLLLL